MKRSGGAFGGVDAKYFCVRRKRAAESKVMSFDAKLDVASLEVKISAIAAVFVEAPLDTVLEVITIVGAVLS